MRGVEIDGIRLIELDEVVDGLRLFRLVENHVDDDFTNIVVPKGFITNGASVPVGVRWLISPTGDLFRAAVVHDYLYYSKKLTRKQSDTVFRDIVYDDTGSWVLSRTAYYGLRMCGGSFWKLAGTSFPQTHLRG